ncbi:MAG: hypothetical protein R2822_24380 [Spirosomataceae bacterium]
MQEVFGMVVPEYYENTTIPNSGLNLKLLLSGLNWGIDLRFLRGKLGLDMTYYDQSSKINPWG